MATDHAAVVRRYNEVWAESDASRRLDVLAEIWADDGIYIDPDVPKGARGAHGLSDLIATSLQELPGLSIAAISDVAILGERAWYRWRATTLDGEHFEGTDIIEFATDGRIERVTNFFDG